MNAKLDSEQLARARQAHIGRLLQQGYRAFNARAIAKLHARGHSHLSLVHTNVLPYIDGEGTRLSTLAERAGITKQAVGQLIAELERYGYIERRADPNDGRATLICFTPAGSTYLHDAVTIKREIEAEYAEELGEEEWETLQSTLLKLVNLSK